MTLYGLSDADVAKIRAGLELASSTARATSASGPASPRTGTGINLHLGKTSGAWTKGSTTAIALYGAGSAGNETAAGGTVECVNKFADVAEDKWVFVARASNGFWYLIAAEC
jgi:hypothetical protein